MLVYIKCLLFFFGRLYVAVLFTSLYSSCQHGVFSLHSLFNKMYFLHNAIILPSSYLCSQFSSDDSVLNSVWNCFSLSTYEQSARLFKKVLFFLRINCVKKKIAHTVQQINLTVFLSKRRNINMKRSYF